MKVLKTALEGAMIVEPQVFNDERGFLMETYHKQRYTGEGIAAIFVQDNLSFSKKGTIRALHYQFPNQQAKLVQVIEGEVFDVAVDIRKGSPTFGQWTGVMLSSENKRQFFIPEGFAHGFCALSEIALVVYKCSDYYAPESENGILWCDPDLDIGWPVKNPVLSNKDKNFLCLKDVSQDQLPTFNLPIL